MTATRTRRCMSCLRLGVCAWDCADREPVPYVGPATRVMEAPQMPTAVRSHRRRVPGWSVASIISGLVLAVMGLGFNEPMARVVWEAIPR